MIQLQIGSMDLLAERVPNIASDSRRTLSPVMVEILTIMSGLLQSRDSGLVKSCARALQSIAAEAQSAEESLLAEDIPLLLEASEESSVVSDIMSALASLMYVGVITRSSTLKHSAEQNWVPVHYRT